MQTCSTTDLWLASKHLAALLEREAEAALTAELGISMTTYALLTTLNASHEHVTQQEIATLLGVTKSSISRHMDAAVDAGLLEPSSSPASRRSRSLSLTAEGTAIVERADTLVEALVPAGAQAEAALRALAQLTAQLERRV